MHPYYLLKDLVEILEASRGVIVSVLYGPKMLGRRDNNFRANPMQKSPPVVPEW